MFPRYLVPSAASARRVSAAKKKKRKRLSGSPAGLQMTLCTPVEPGGCGLDLLLLALLRADPHMHMALSRLEGLSFCELQCGGSQVAAGPVVERGGIDHHFGLVECVNLVSVRLTSPSCHV